MLYHEDSIFDAVKKCWLKKWVSVALLLTLCRLCFRKSFQSDNHVYCDLNDSTLDFFI